jgi:hypothetical protein
MRANQNSLTELDIYLKIDPTSLYIHRHAPFTTYNRYMNEQATNKLHHVGIPLKIQDQENKKNKKRRRINIDPSTRLTIMHLPNHFMFSHLSPIKARTNSIQPEVVMVVEEEPSM